jgi:uncharacterized protein YecT (DUF1311 family)
MMHAYGRLLAVALWASAASGSAPGLAWSADNGCEDATTTAQMRDCADRRYSQADAELNRVKLDPARRRLLRDAQRAWVAFRDKNSAFAASAAAGGTLYPVLEMSERASMTEDRT